MKKACFWATAVSFLRFYKNKLKNIKIIECFGGIQARL